MSISVVGSVAYDSVKTPLGQREEVLGGSAIYFSAAASYFCPVSIVAVVGSDFRADELVVLEARDVDTTGLVRAQGKTFRWSGEYGENINDCHTLETQLNVFAHFRPQLSPQAKSSPYLFLANIDPDLQYDVLQKMDKRPKVVAGDTMNLWIQQKTEALKRVLATLDILMINDSEAYLLAGEWNLVKAAKHILSLGPKMVLIKRGEYGAIGFTGDSIFAAPAYPLEMVVDPTGAGDSFAGGFMGYIAATGDTSMEGFRRATILGSVMASFAVESFSLERLNSLTYHDIQKRFRDFKNLTQFEDLKEGEIIVKEKVLKTAHEKEGS
ncbi:MAG: PfkB family carbohydrate kinase [Dehalococcoidia bacterium]